MKLELDNLANLNNQNTVVSTINNNNDAIEAAIENTLSRDGTTPNHMLADLDMNSNRILNCPDALSAQEPVTLSQLQDGIDAISQGALLGPSYVTLGTNALLENERILTAGSNISIADGGPGGNIEIAVTGIGSVFQAHDGDLDGLSALSTTGLVTRTATDTYTTRTLTGPAEGISVTNGSGVAGNPTIALSNDLNAIEGLSSTGLATRTATDTWAQRTITGTANEITITNGNGVSGNPTVSIPSSLTFTGKTITGGSFSSPAITTPTGIIKSDVGLGNVDNTSDATKNSASATLTNKTVNLTNNTLTGTTAEFNTALSDNDFATLAGTETLTNKTLTTPVISTISNSGTVTIPTGTRTLVARDTTDTLTNKTLTSPVINTPTGIVKGDVGLGNVDNTSDATKNSATATLTNKTINGSNNTITNIGGSAIRMGSDAQGDVLYFNGTDYARLGAGTSGQFLKTNGTGANPAWTTISGGGDMLAANYLSELASGTATNKETARSSIWAAPFDALAYNGMQVNGSMEVSQENGTSSVSFPTGVQDKYIVDGWKFTKSGTSVLTGQQVAPSLAGYTSAIRITVGTAQASIGSDYVVLRHPIEGYRMSRAGWGAAGAAPITVGFWAKMPVTGTYGVALYNSAFNSSATGTFTINSANTYEWKTVTFSGVTTGTWLKTNGVGGVFDIAIASGAQTPNAVANTSYVTEITGVVVLPGLELPPQERAPFIMRPFTHELLTCSRYYQKIQRMMTLAFNTTGVVGVLNWSPPMRSTPTISTATAVLTVNRPGTGDFTQSSPSSGSGGVGSNNTEGGSISMGNFSGLTSGSLYLLRPSGSEFIPIDARL